MEAAGADLSLRPELALSRRTWSTKREQILRCAQDDKERSEGMTERGEGLRMTEKSEGMTNRTRRLLQVGISAGRRVAEPPH